VCIIASLYFIYKILFIIIILFFYLFYIHRSFANNSSIESWNFETILKAHNDGTIKLTNNELNQLEQVDK